LKVWLGLADDDEGDYEDEEYYEDPPAEPALARPKSYTSPYEGSSAVTRVERKPDLDRARDPRRSGSFDSMARGFSDAPGPDTATEYQPPPRPSYDRERPLASVSAPQVQMHVVEPRAFHEAQAIADRFKAGTPIIMNLSSSDADLAKRLLDFASGLTYGLDGGLRKVADKVFMLTPRNVDVSDEDRRRLKDKGLFTLE
jgi:cell division inhibitor SepF